MTEQEKEQRKNQGQQMPVDIVQAFMLSLIADKTSDKHAKALENVRTELKGEIKELKGDIKTVMGLIIGGFSIIGVLIVISNFI